ncbi:MAG: hypothetical protein P1P90_06525 [Patescibacteria group bacterium]|nr:hypothetical protein [Patescibacteria group bacterium]
MIPAATANTSEAEGISRKGAAAGTNPAVTTDLYFLLLDPLDPRALHPTNQTTLRRYDVKTLS